MSPRDLVKVPVFCRAVGITVCQGGADAGCNGWQLTVIQMGLVKHAGVRSSSSCGAVGVCLLIGPLCVAQECGFQSRVQRKEGLYPGDLRL